MHVNEMNTQGAWLWQIEQPALATETSATNSSVISVAAVDSFEAAPQRTVFDDALGIDSAGNGYDDAYRAGTVQERFSAVMNRLAENEALFHDVFEQASLDYDHGSVESIRVKTMDGSVSWQLQPVMVDNMDGNDVRGDLQSSLETGPIADPASVGSETASDGASSTDSVDVLFDRVREFLREFSVRSVFQGFASA